MSFYSLSTRALCSERKERDGEERGNFGNQLNSQMKFGTNIEN